jgi:hypothetical protein
VTPRDEIRPLYLTMLTLGVVALVILAAGLVDFFAFEPLGQSSGAHATVKGVFHYDPATGQVSGPDRQRFSADEPFAAVVDWTSLPPTMEVAARWFNTLGTTVGGAGPAPAGQLTDHPIVPVKTPPGFRHNVPGDYNFVIERYREGQPVEVLARRLVYVRSAA